MVLASITILGGLLEHMNFPCLELIRLVVIGGIENLDLLVLCIWILGGIIKIVVLHYCSTLATTQLFKLKNYGPVAIINGLVLLLVATWSFENVVDVGWEDAVELAHLVAVQGVPVFLSVQVGLPLLLLIIALITGKRGKKDDR